MALLLSFVHFLASEAAILLLSACSSVAERLIFMARDLCSKSLFILRFVAFLGALWSYICCIVVASEHFFHNYAHSYAYCKAFNKPLNVRQQAGWTSAMSLVLCFNSTKQSTQLRPISGALCKGKK